MWKEGLENLTLATHTEDRRIREETVSNNDVEGMDIFRCVPCRH